MKAYLNIHYYPVGGFTLWRELTREQVLEARHSGTLFLPLMGRASEMSVTVVEHPGQDAFVRFKDASFAGSRELPEPTLFRNHMSAYRQNGWELVENSNLGFFDFSEAYKRAIRKPVAMNCRLRAYLASARWR